MDGGVWWAAVHGVAKSRTRLSDFPFTFHFNALEKEMATHSSVLAWRIPGTGEPGGLPSMGSHRVGHDWSDLAAVAAANINTASAWVLWKGWARGCRTLSPARAWRLSWRKSSLNYVLKVRNWERGQEEEWDFKFRKLNAEKPGIKILQFQVWRCLEVGCS